MNGTSISHRARIRVHLFRKTIVRVQVLTQVFERQIWICYEYIYVHVLLYIFKFQRCNETG